MAGLKSKALQLVDKSMKSSNLLTLKSAVKHFSYYATETPSLLYLYILMTISLTPWHLLLG